MSEQRQEGGGQAPRPRTLFEQAPGGGPESPLQRASPRPARAPQPPAPWPELAVPLEAALRLTPGRRRQLAALGLRTVEQAVRYLPRRHDDRSRLYQVAEIRAPGPCAVVVEVRSVHERRPRRGLHLLQAQLADATGAIPATWFNQGYLARVVAVGARLLCVGEAALDRTGRLSLRAPEVEALPPGAEPQPPGILPVYALTAGVRQRTVRAVTESVLDRFAGGIPDTLPAGRRAHLGLPAPADAWRHIHYPPSPAALQAARRAIVLEELYHLQVGLLLRRAARAGALRGFRHAEPGELTRRFTAGLPFALTAAQRRVLAEIDADLASPRPMYRLLQGDVGAGKTVVAAAAMLRAVEGGRQAALLAPTEVLAEQHSVSLRRLYGGLGRTELLTGTTPRAVRRQLLIELAEGRLDVLVGTHALLQPDVGFRALGLAVTDEQHRFGVRQRDALSAKGNAPDVLVMTATPIPRTLAMTLYGDLDVSILDELPPGRRPVRTFLRTPAGRPRIYDFLRDQARAGRQAFVVCPLISDGAPEAPEAAGAPEPPSPEAEAAAAERWAERLAQRLGTEVRLGLLHGRLPSAAKEETMARFAAGEIDVLVTTTVIEVGVDVPNATVMVIEDAERFGLAQLHQLRGRVGRGPHPSYCILVSGSGAERLAVLTQTTDGFAIAEEDLRQRGPGEVLGTRQHGLPELALADPVADGELLHVARDWARETLREDSALAEPRHAALRRAVEALMGGPRG